MDEKTRKLIAARIKAGRQAKGMTVEEVSSRIGLGTSRWLNWECAARTPKLDMLPKIAAALGTSAAWIAGFSDHQGDTSDSWRYIVPTGEDETAKRGSNDALAFNLDKLHARNLPEREVQLLTVRDNSLSPALTEGDAVLVDRRQTPITAPAIYAIRDGSGLIWFRWIRPEIKGGYCVYTGDKEHFPDQLFSQDELSSLNIVGKYLGHWHWHRE